ncbi:MAG: thiamine pyrophosphate-binding protein, partial [Burkholderiales bacterium]
MLVVNERLARASSFEIVATPDPAVPHRVLDQFTSLNLAPSRFSVRRVNAQTASIHVAFESLDAERARRIASRLRRIVGVKGVELSLAIHPVAESAIRPALTTAPSHDLTARDGADLLLETLAAVGVDTIFGYPGGAALPIYDALFKQSRIRHILVRHEQAAAHAAEGYARSTGRVGVVLVTSGPGVTNTITGLMDALMDSVPVLCISGQVGTRYLGTDAFQEAPTTALTRPCTKYNRLVACVEDIEPAVRHAYEVARGGRPGPVLLDIPKDVQLARAPAGACREPSPIPASCSEPSLDASLIAEAADLIFKA